MQFLIFILSTVGLSWGITRSKLLFKFRGYISKCFKSTPNLALWTLDSILNCWGCAGFWCGTICYFLLKYDCEVILYGLCGVSASLLIIGLLNLIERK